MKLIDAYEKALELPIKAMPTVIIQLGETRLYLQEHAAGEEGGGIGLTAFPGEEDPCKEPTMVLTVDQLISDRWELNYNSTKPSLAFNRS